MRIKEHVMSSPEEWHSFGLEHLTSNTQEKKTPQSTDKWLPSTIGAVNRKSPFQAQAFISSRRGEDERQIYALNTTENCPHQGKFAEINPIMKSVTSNLKSIYPEKIDSLVNKYPCSLEKSNQ